MGSGKIYLIAGDRAIAVQLRPPGEVDDAFP
jgi:hypothetical protein